MNTGSFAGVLPSLGAAYPEICRHQSFHRNSSRLASRLVNLEIDYHAMPQAVLIDELHEHRRAALVQ